MNISVVFLIVSSFVLAHGTGVRYESNLLDSKKTHGPVEFQATSPTDLEVSTGRSVQEDLQRTQHKFQATRMDNIASRDESQILQHSQAQSPIYQPQDHFATGSPAPQDQDFSRDQGFLHSQSRIPQGTSSQMGIQAKEQFDEFMPEQQFYTNGQQQSEQQQFYRDNLGVGIEQRMNSERAFQAIASQKGQQKSEKHVVGVQTRFVPAQPLQLSAFNNREHPIVLPQVNHAHSSSVVVSGLKNLPVLPAMVYNAGPAPSTHAITYGRDSWYHGGASMRHHLQTPYVRYVY
ncbi:hypothetical protein X975_12059, partial [Stegodyphus mimosarum]